MVNKTILDSYFTPDEAKKRHEQNLVDWAGVWKYQGIVKDKMYSRENCYILFRTKSQYQIDKLKKNPAYEIIIINKMEVKK